ncbi:MAG: hypothetical protein NVSMB18_16260 [Acetobacteraceae bacterium]
MLTEMSYLGLKSYNDPTLGAMVVGTTTVAMPDPAAGPHAAAGVAAVSTLTGGSVPAVIGGLTPHTWVADAQGLYHTSADLTAEWHAIYQKMLDGHADLLTPIQRLEGNSEAVFVNTGISHQSAAHQAAYREDIQREIDSIAAAMTVNAAVYGSDPNQQFTAQTYTALTQTLQASPVLHELAVQGHGLNKPPAERYDGYTNDIQNRTDNITLYVGGGLDNGEKAVAAFLDDVVLTHAPFATVAQNGKLIQLNQNGDRESTLADQVTAIDQSMFQRVYVSSDFSANAQVVGAVVTVPGASVQSVAVPAPSPTTSLDGAALPHQISGLTAHTWVANGVGLYVTSADLKSEWQGLYAQMLAGHGDQLTAVQRMEGNAEAVLENTAAAHLSAARQAQFRQDAQREFDAIGAAMTIDSSVLGIDPKLTFTTSTYLAMEQTLQGSEALKELAIQGHGLNHSPAAKYDGFTQHSQNRTDNKTYYVGGALDSGEKAIATFFDDVILSHASFPTVMHNGTLTQLNQNGNREDTVAAVVKAANDLMYSRVLVAADFSATATATGPEVTLATAADYQKSLLAKTTVAAKPTKAA